MVQMQRCLLSFQNNSTDG